MAPGCSVTLAPVLWQVCRERKPISELFTVLGSVRGDLQSISWGGALAAFQSQNQELFWYPNSTLLNIDLSIDHHHKVFMKYRVSPELEFCLSHLVAFLHEATSFICSVGMFSSSGWRGGGGAEKSACCDLLSPLQEQGENSHVDDP